MPSESAERLPDLQRLRRQESRENNKQRRQKEFDETVAKVHIALKGLSFEGKEQFPSIVSGYKHLLTDAFAACAHEGTLQIHLETPIQLMKAQEILYALLSACTDPRSTQYSEGYRQHWKDSVIPPKAAIAIPLRYGLDGKGKRSWREIGDMLGLRQTDGFFATSAVSRLGLWGLGQTFIDEGIVSFEPKLSYRKT